MRRRNATRGMTLVELVIGAGLLGGLVLVASQVMVSGQKGMSDAQTRAGFQNALNIVSGSLQKYMTTNDFRFFAFAGDPAGSPDPGPKPMGRVLIPQVSRCRDLSTGGGCAEQSSYLYVNYDKGTPRALLSVCLLQPDAGDPSKIWSLILNIEDATYGTVAYDQPTKTLSVTDIGSELGTVKLDIDSGTLLATFDPPKATLWVATGRVIATKLHHGGGNSVLKQDGTPIPDTCLNQLPLDPVNPPKKKLNKIYEIPVKPFSLQQFTGLATVTDGEVLTTVANMPLRTGLVELRSVGPMPLASAPGKFDFGISQCQVASNAFAVTCDGSKSLAAVSPVDRVRVDELFALNLVDGGGNPVTLNRYELLGAGMTPSKLCAAPSCGSLTVPANGAIPGLVNANERLDNLISTGFSFIKQESLSDLKFRVLTNSTEAGESFNVHFP